MFEMCAPCSALWHKWLDATPPRRLAVAYGSGAPYDASVRGVAERRRASGDEWWALVRAQTRGISQACREGRHVRAPGGSVPPPGVVTIRALD